MQGSGVNPKGASHKASKRSQIRGSRSDVRSQRSRGGWGGGHRGTGETGYLQVVSVGVASCPSECWGRSMGEGAEEKKKKGRQEKEKEQVNVSERKRHR